MEGISQNPYQSKQKSEDMELNLLSEDRINFKLSLRKRKFDEILAKKRNIPTKPIRSSRPYELFLSKLILPPNFKIIYSKEDELISKALESMKSDEINIVLYGVCLIKTYLENSLDDKSVLNKLNLNFVSDMLNLLEKWGEKKELQIIYNILHILTNYSFLNENKLITKILLSSKGYKVWEMCFDLQNYEVMSQMMYLLHNITFGGDESTYNLAKSNFFRNKIFNFYSNQNIIKHLNEKNEENIFFIIIKNGLDLFANLISIQFPSTYDKVEKNKLIIPVFELILKYCQSNTEKIYHSCIYAISSAVEEDLDLVNKIDNYYDNGINIISDILDKKFFSNNNIVLHANRILGNYISMKSGLSEEFYNKCIQYEFDVFFGNKLNVAIRETYWVLSNILFDYRKTALIICFNESFINQTFNKYQNPTDYDDIYNIAYFLNCLIYKCGYDQFIKLLDRGIVDITLNYTKMTFNKPKALITIFQLVESLLHMGETARDNFMGTNKVKERCDSCGLEEMLEKYEDTRNVELFDIIDKIKNNYYNE